MGEVVMGGFTKLFSRILTSSIWSESNEVRIVWITLLAATGPDGIARCTLPGLARLAHLKLEETEEAIRVLSAPDKYSRTVEHEGRRIREERAEDGSLIGWFVYNYSRHRAVDATAAERQRRRRQSVTRDRHASQKTEVQKTEVRTDGQNGRPANPLIQGKRTDYERESLTLTSRIAELTGEDPVEVFAQAAHYEGALRQKVNPAGLSDDRLLNTVIDLRKTLKNLQTRERRA